MPSGWNPRSHGVCSSHSQTIFTSITHPTLRSKHGIATHWYPTGQPGPCQHVPEAVHQSFKNLLLNTIQQLTWSRCHKQDTSYTVAIPRVMNITTHCGDWLVVKNTDNPDIEPLRATITTTCTQCGANDLCKFDAPQPFGITISLMRIRWQPSACSGTITCRIVVQAPSQRK